MRFSCPPACQADCWWAVSAANRCLSLPAARVVLACVGKSESVSVAAAEVRGFHLEARRALPVHSQDCSSSSSSSSNLHDGTAHSDVRAWPHSPRMSRAESREGGRGRGSQRPPSVLGRRGGGRGGVFVVFARRYSHGSSNKFVEHTYNAPIQTTCSNSGAR